MDKNRLKRLLRLALNEAKKEDKGKKLTGSAGKLRGDMRKGRLEKEKPGGEIDKCNVDNPPKSCYDEWENDKKYDKNESILRETIRDILLEKKKKDGSGEKGKDIKVGNLSPSTVKKIKKIADERGYTPGSMKKEYVLGLRAWLNGHPPGVPQHAWAMGRIKKATESHDWSVVKKSKAKKKD